MSLTTTQLALTKLYLAAFNRAPEKGGFDYWSSQLAAGKSFDDVVKTVFSLDIVKAIYPDTMSNSDFVTAIYRNIFGREPDSGGLAYWLSQLTGGRDRSALVLTMIDTGLGTPDGTPGKAFIANRYDASQYAVEQQFASGADIGVARLKSLLQTVDADGATLAAAKTKIGVYVTDAIPPDTPTLALANDTGVTGDKITIDPTLRVTGQEAGATLEYAVYSTPENADPNIAFPAFIPNPAWTRSFTPTPGMRYLVAVRQVDAADNVSAASNYVSFTYSSDIKAPTLASSTPADKANAFAVGNNIVLNFDEAVYAGSGNILITDGGSDTRTIAVTDTSQVSFNGKTVTINPADDLALGKTYHLKIASGAITDLVGNVFASSSSLSTLDFSTVTPITSINLARLNGANGFRLDGIVQNLSPFAYAAGISVGGAGDVNGDGYDDVIVGFPNVQYGSGYSYVVFGKSSGFAASMLAAGLNGTNGFRLDSAQNASGRSGASVGLNGDLNGDGYSDAIIGAPFSSFGGSSLSGSGYVVFGKASGYGSVTSMSGLSGSNGFRIDGTAANNDAGTSVSFAGDINGDGFDDLVIGATGTSFNNQGSGSAYVMFGKASGFDSTLALSSLTGANGFRMDGKALADRVGQSVAAAGDVNGDGYDDLLIGSNEIGIGSGTSYVVYGKATGFSATVNLDNLKGPDGFKIISDGSFGSFAGYSVNSAGDINGDGYMDLIVGAPADSDIFAPTAAGNAYVVFGKATGFGSAIFLSSLDGSDGFRLAGASAGDRAGYSVSSAGDINADGYDDLIVAAKGVDTNVANSGTAYVIYGKASGFASAISLSNIDSSVGFRIDGLGVGEAVGTAVSAAGDVNGDGYADLIVGAEGAYWNGSGSESAYVIFGGNFNGAVTYEGTTGDDLITGGAKAEVFVGGPGNDTLIGGGGADVFHAGAGNDVIVVSNLGFRRIDGGSGNDTFKLSGANLILNLADFRNKIAGVETIDLTGTGNNTLTLTARDVTHLSDSTNTLTVEGNAGDVVDLDSGWTDGGIVNGHHVYTQGQAVVLVGTALTVI
ncbi:DUF4214 domain-containing protein [Herbaspirillum sp. HC18]|nr:DUF4214 domain-containing protein [Herbaspirillum sp. HC18]